MSARIMCFAVAAGLATCPLAAGEDKHAELAKRIHQAVVDKAPKVYEDRADWGRTMPILGPMRLDRLRTRVQVGDRVELPDGVWQRSKIWLDDPAKDITIRVRDLRALDAKTTRLQVEATVALHGERERRRWRKGLQLFGLTVQADAVVGITLDLDLKLSFNTDKFPPELLVEPKVVASRLELKEFDLLRVGNLLEGEPARELGNELKGLLQELLREREPDVKEYANRAIVKSLTDGKISAAKLLGMPAKGKE